MSDPATTQPTSGAGPGGRPMTPSERARAAALARWGKYKGKGKQPAPKKGRKPAATPEAKEAARRQEAQKNRAATLESFGSFGRDTLPDLEAMASGKEAANPDAMIMSGLAEKLPNGTVVLTAEGKRLYNAASKGDVGAAKDAIAKAESNSMAKDEKAKAKADKEKPKEGEEEKPKAGGGGGGGSKEKPSDDEKEAAAKEKASAKREATRADVKEKMADSDTGLAPAGFDAFTSFADGGKLDPAVQEGFTSMGLTEGSPARLTEAGRSLRSAIDRGDLRGAVDAIERGKSKKTEAGERDKAKADRETERAKTKAEREQAALDRAKERDAERKTPRRALRDGIQIKGTDMDYADTLTSLLDIADSLEEDDTATKAGRRNRAADQAMLDACLECAAGVVALLRSLGAVERVEEYDPFDSEGGTVMDPNIQPVSVVKTIGDELVFAGDEVKTIGDGWTQGYLVRFGGEGDLTNYRDVFTPQTDYGAAKSSDVYVHHRQLPGLGKRQLKNAAQLSFDEVGVFVKHLLDMRDPYEKAVYDLARQGKLGWSSGTAPHLVDRKSVGDGRHIIEKWPLGLDASYTPTPAGGLEMTTAALKSLYEADELLLDAIDADLEANQETKTIEDQGSTLAEMDLVSDRERLLSLTLRRLRIKETA